MTGIDLIAVAPWVLFGAVLSAVCIRLLRSRRAEPRHGRRIRYRPAIATHRTRNAPRRTHQPGGGSPSTARRDACPALAGSA